MGGAVPKRWRSVWCMLCAIHVSARLCRRHRQALTLAPTPCDHHTPGLPALGTVVAARNCRLAQESRSPGCPTGGPNRSLHSSYDASSCPSWI